MSRLATVFVLVLAATAADAQDTKSEQTQTPAVASAKGTRPFLFDGRMPGDGARQGSARQRSSSQRWRHRRATESKPAWARKMSPRTRLLNYSSAPCPL
jgi:hypothetical protein